MERIPVHGGRGILPGRPNDPFSIGYDYIDFKGGAFGETLGLEGNEQGVELYYEAEVLPWFHITPNLQVVDPGLSANDSDWILGVRGNLRS